MSQKSSVPQGGSFVSMVLKQESPGLYALTLGDQQEAQLTVRLD